MSAEVIQESLLPTLLALSQDPIPNIRFNVAKSLGVIIPILREAGMKNIIDGEIAQRLQQLEADSDQEVKYFGHQAMITSKQPTNIMNRSTNIRSHSESIEMGSTGSMDILYKAI